MGQTMTCCGNSNVDNNDIKTNDFHNKYSNLKNADKVNMIIKIQAVFRGYLTRKRIQEIQGTRGFSGMGGYDGGMQNYENEGVMRIRE